jgi:hypothetical protein
LYPTKYEVTMHEGDYYNYGDYDYDYDYDYYG